ncbi:MAG: DUF1385 domain-containing protein [Thermoleophilaceae bacterium]
MTAPVPDDKLRLGGMALRNGLLVHGPTHWAAAVRTDRGAVKVASGRKPRLGGRAAERLPGVRGVVKLAEAMAVIPLVKRALPEARLPMQDVKTLGTMGAAALGGQAIRTARRGAAREAAVALVSVGPALMALRTGDLAAYHGVEHKAIAAYEQGTDAAEAAKEHDRCGSNLVAPMLISSVAGNVIVRSVLGARGPVAGVAVTLVGVAASVEMFAWSERNRETSLARAFRRPGYEMQRLFATREPSPEQLDVGRAALAEILRLEAPAARDM